MKTFVFTHERNNKLSWMNGKNRRKIGFFSKHGVGSWVKSFDSEHYLKERDRYVVLRLTLPSSSVGISSLTITYELWFSSLQDIYFFTALSFYFTKVNHYSLFKLKAIIIQVGSIRKCAHAPRCLLIMSTNNQRVGLLQRALGRRGYKTGRAGTRSLTL